MERKHEHSLGYEGALDHTPRDHLLEEFKATHRLRKRQHFVLGRSVQLGRWWKFNDRRMNIVDRWWKQLLLCIQQVYRSCSRLCLHSINGKLDYVAQGTESSPSWSTSPSQIPHQEAILAWAYNPTFSQVHQNFKKLRLLLSWLMLPERFDPANQKWFQSNLAPHQEFAWSLIRWWNCEFNIEKLLP